MDAKIYKLHISGHVKSHTKYKITTLHEAIYSSLKAAKADAEYRHKNRYFEGADKVFTSIAPMVCDALYEFRENSKILIFEDDEWKQSNQ